MPKPLRGAQITAFVRVKVGVGQVGAWARHRGGGFQRAGPPRGVSGMFRPRLSCSVEACTHALGQAGGDLFQGLVGHQLARFARAVGLSQHIDTRDPGEVRQHPIL